MDKENKKELNILVKAIQEFKSIATSYTFKANEEYCASRVNKSWWIIDSVGISDKDFNENFIKI